MVKMVKMVKKMRLIGEKYKRGQLNNLVATIDKQVSRKPMEKVVLPLNASVEVCGDRREFVPLILSFRNGVRAIKCLSLWVLKEISKPK